MPRNNQNNKILLVIRYFYPFIGGTEKQALALASALTKKGKSIEIITSRFSRRWPAKEVIEGVEVIRLSSPRIKFFGALLFLVSLCGYLYKNRGRYEIIHTFQIGYTSAIATLMGKILGKTVVIKLASSGYGGDVNRHKRTPWGRLFLCLCRLSACFIVLNRQMEAELIEAKFVPGEIVHIPNGVDLTVFDKADTLKLPKKKMGTNKEKIILYTGRLSTEKGVDFLIKAYARLNPAISTRLYILGEGPEHTKLQGLIERYHVAERVKMIPEVNEVAAYLSNSDIFVMPSRFEGLSNSLLEAMACGLPVIATNVRGNAELIEDGVDGLLVENDNVDSLVEALSLLLSVPGKGREFGQRGRKKVENIYDMGKIAERYIQLYRNL
jgi:glycosyltransferase involved in cell wall biosynthesis